MNLSIAYSSETYTIPEFSTVEPGVHHFLGRILSSGEKEVLENIWNNLYPFLLKKNFIDNLFPEIKVVEDNRLELAPSLILRLTPFVFRHMDSNSYQEDLYQSITTFLPAFIANGSFPFSCIFSGNVGIPGQFCNNGFWDASFHFLSQPFNMMGIPGYRGDFWFNQGYHQCMDVSMLGIGTLPEYALPEKDDLVLLLSDAWDDSSSWSSSAVPGNMFFYQRLTGFIGEANSQQLMIVEGAPVYTSLYSSLFLFVRLIHLGIAISVKNRPFQYNQVLVVCKPGFPAGLPALAQKWNIRYTIAGQLLNDHRFTNNESGSGIDIPLNIIDFLSKNTKEPFKRASSPRLKSTPAGMEKYPEPADYRDTAWTLFNHINIKSKNWITENFDSTIGNSNMHINFPSNANIVNLKGTGNALVISAFSRQDYIRTSPKEGTAVAMAELMRKLICTGATPRHVTPVFFIHQNSSEEETASIRKMVKEIHHYAGIFKIKVVRPEFTFHTLREESEPDNLPLLNLFGTGLISDKMHHMTIAFKNKGDMIYLIGQSEDDIQSSVYMREQFHVTDSVPPAFQPDDELDLHFTILELIKNNLIHSAHDVSAGGLFTALAESAMVKNFGFDITTDAEVRKDAFLFGESQSRVVVTVTPHRETEFIDFMVTTGTPFSALGHVTREEIRIDDISYGFVSDFQKEYFTSPR